MKIKNIYLLLLASMNFLFLLNSCEKTVFTEVEKNEILPSGKLFIESSPGPAQVYLNGKNTGYKTNDTIKNVVSGTYKVTLKQSLLKDTTFIVTITTDNLTKSFIDYYANPGHFGSIYCDANKNGASIYLDGKSTNNVTPFTINNIFPGVHLVKFTLPMHRADSIKVTVEGGKKAIATVTLVDTTNVLSYNISNSPITSNHLSSVVVDQNNIKWIGTRDQGLCAFDGKNWTIYKQSNSKLIYDFISALAVDSKNVLWIATTGGLMSKNGNIWTNYTSNLPATYVTSIAFDKLGNTWIGTQNGLVKFNGSTWQVFNTSNSQIAGDFVTCVTVDNNNKVWYGTNAFGLGVFDGTSWKGYNMSNMMLQKNLGNHIKDIKVDNSGVVWAAHVQNLIAGDLGGFSKLENSAWSIVTLAGVPSDQVETIYIDSQNYKWVGTKGGLAKFLTPLNISVFTTSNSKIPAMQIVGIGFDANSDLFVASFGGGLGRIKKGNY